MNLDAEISEAIVKASKGCRQEMEQRPPPEMYHYGHYYQYPPHPSVYGYNGHRPHPSSRYDPYGRPPQGYPAPGYPQAPDFDRNYGRQSGLPEPSQQENLPVVPRSQYQSLPSPTSVARSPTSVDSSARASPLISESGPDPTDNMTDKEKRTFMQNEKRKARNREAQRKAREKQKKTIEDLNIQLMDVRKQNERLKQERDELQAQMNRMKHNIEQSPLYGQTDLSAHFII